MNAFLRRFRAPALSFPVAGPGGAGALCVSGVSKAFGATRVLDDVSFTTAPGEFVTLLGPSGCGKTTLLRIVAGLERADAGTVALDGVALDALPANRRPVNTVFQSYALFPHLSVFENVAFGLRARRLPDPEVRQRVAAGLELLRLSALGDRRPDQLSGGQRQRVALARALVNEPHVLLLDEPLSALDARLRGEVQLELRRLQRALGRTFLLVTHDQDEAMTVSDRLVVMDGGRIVQSGPAAEVYQRPRTRFVAEFLGGANLLPASAAGERRVRTPLGEFELEAPVPWSEGTIAIHPRWVEAAGAAAPAAGNGVQARVQDVVLRGDHALLVAEGGLRAQLAPDALPTAGEALWLRLPAERLVPLED